MSEKANIPNMVINSHNSGCEHLNGGAQTNGFFRQDELRGHAEAHLKVNDDYFKLWIMQG